MKLGEFSLVNNTERKIESLLCEVEGLKSIAFNGVNLQGTKKIMVDITLENGQRHRLYCSENVSAGIRNKSITKEMLFGFPIILVTVEDEKTGETRQFYRIEMPTSAVNNWIEVEASSLKVEEFVQSVANYEELIA